MCTVSGTSSPCCPRSHQPVVISTGAYIALAGGQALLLGALGLNTSLKRKKYKVAGAYDTNDQQYAGLYQAQRAHGNQAEWGPMFALLFLLVFMGEAAVFPDTVTVVDGVMVSTSNRPVWSLIIAIWATLGRVAAAYALGFTPSLTTATGLRRFAGLSTYLTCFILSGYAIYLGSQM